MTHHAERINLGTGFSRHFCIDTALDGPLLDEVYRIRHEVYCEDLHFESERADRREIDEYDAHSVNCLLRTLQAPQVAVGCTRLVLTDPRHPDAPLPFERVCARTLDRALLDPARLPRTRIAEISRLAVCAAFRRRKGEERRAVVVRARDFASSGELPRFPYIPTSLLLGAVALAEHNGIESVFVLTEPRLAQHFRKLGVEVRQIGAPIEHHGLRIPSVMQVDEILRNMRSMLRPMWEVVRAQIAAGFIPTPSSLPGRASDFSRRCAPPFAP